MSDSFSSHFYLKMSNCRYNLYERKNFDEESEFPKKYSRYRNCRKKSVPKTAVGLGRKRKKVKKSAKVASKKRKITKRKKSVKKKSLKVKKNGCRFCRKNRSKSS